MLAILSCTIGVRADDETKQKQPPPSLSEIVLFGTRPVSELASDRYRQSGRPCVTAYLAAISPKSSAILNLGPAGYDDAVKARRLNVTEQMAVILGEGARDEAERFAFAVPLSPEWEGMSEGPVNEANFVDNWLEKRSKTAVAILPFLHLFKAHRLRAGYEAAKFGNEKGLWPILSRRYHESLEKARASGNALITCIADDLDAQPFVYLDGQGRP